MEAYHQYLEVLGDNTTIVQYKLRYKMIAVSRKGIISFPFNILMFALGILGGLRFLKNNREKSEKEIRKL